MELIEAIIIKTQKYKDDSKIVSLMTAEGLFSAIGKGSFKVTSKNFYLLQEITKIATDLKINTNSFNIIRSSKLVDNYTLIKSDVNKIEEVLEILELSSVFGEHIIDYKVFYNFLCEILDKIKVNKNVFLFKVIFKIKLLYLLGIAPVFSCCTECESKSDLVGFDIESGGMKCKSCYDGRALLSNEILLDFKKLYLTKLDKIHDDISVSNINQCNIFVDTYYEKYLGYKIKTSNIFSKLK